MRVLGVDPGLTRCGFGVIEGAPGQALTMVATGVAVTSADDSIDRACSPWKSRSRAG